MLNSLHIRNNHSNEIANEVTTLTFGLIEIFLKNKQNREKANKSKPCYDLNPIQR